MKHFGNKDNWEYKPGSMYTSFDIRMAINYSRGELLGVLRSSEFFNTWKLKCL